MTEAESAAGSGKRQVEAGEVVPGKPSKGIGSENPVHAPEPCSCTGEDSKGTVSSRETGEGDSGPEDRPPSCCAGKAGSSHTGASCSAGTGTDGSAEILPATGAITTGDRFDHFLARWGWKRMEHRVTPGLYRLGSPGPESPVIVTANYTLSFDVVRSFLNGTDCYILVLDTHGVNVWCAAGKGTFGTEELIARIEATGLSSVVSHKRIVLPQLGAPGICAHEVQKRSGFRVEYGPVRAGDLPRYLAAGKATPAMRRVEFPLTDRLILTPMETVHVAFPTAAVAIALYLIAGPLAALAAATAVLAGTVLFPALMPVLPSRDFSSRGMILGGIVAVPFAVAFAYAPWGSAWAGFAAGLVPLLLMPAVTAYLSLNFTGSTTFTSRTGVKREIFRYVPIMTVMAVSGIVIAAALGIARLMGVA